jgi:S1-C subfamily serine protease
MGESIGRSFRLTVYALVGLSGLVISCAGPMQARPQPASLSTRTNQPDPRTAVTVRLEAADLGTPPAPHQGQVRVSEEFSAPQLEQKFEAVARRVIPCVVAISAVDTPVQDEAVQHPGQATPEKLDAALATQDRTVGTGFVIDGPAGYVLTNEHVISKCRQLWVTTDDHQVFPAVVIGSDPRSDLAVLKIPGHRLKAVNFAKSDPRRGQWTLAIGNPYGLAGDGEMAVSVGVVSATNRSLPRLSGKEDRLYQDLIQTTAQINPGNSGGPLFDLNGDVIGINCAVILPVKQSNGIGFALPINARVRSVIERLKEGRAVKYGYIGVRTSTPGGDECRKAGLANLASAARIDFVEPGSPAEAAGLAVGDLVTSIGDERVLDSDHFIRVVGDCLVGPPVPLSVQRNGKQASFKVSLRPREMAGSAVTRETQRFTWRGLLLGTRTNGPGIEVLAVESDSPLGDQVKQGDVLASIGDQPLTSVSDLLDALAKLPSERCILKVAEHGVPQVSTARE